ncbi:hypothetical protein EC991_004825 [Linnemannia zychae]|nr:hypothetical protein EC991_004825 [Linnemannia zychae]
MIDKASATISGTTAQAANASTDDDATLMRQLEEELKNTSMDDDDGVSSSSSSVSNASAKVQANMLSAREQEAADQGMLDGVQIFFENQFVEAQRIFATQDQVNPVYALGSGALAFMKGN